MEIGNQIKALRLGRGVTQEAMAEALGVSGQAVSKWETGAAAPDIGFLPELSAYFGVTIDELFALTDETRMERIKNMLDSQRELAGDIPGAITRLEEYLEMRRTDYGNSGDAGEEWLKGEIERLKKKL